MTNDRADQRRSLRAEIEIQAAVSSSRIGRYKVEVLDISRHGCRFASVSRFDEGVTLIITFPDLTPIGATVRWSDIESCGIEFNMPLHPEVLARLERR